MKVFTLVVLMLLISCSAICANVGSIILTGTQKEQSVTLKANMKPYVLRGEYVVPAGKEIIIEGGSIIEAEKDSELTISGKLRINGTKDKPVVLKGKAKGFAYWKGVLLQKCEDTLMRYCEISGANIAICINNSQSSKFEACFIHDNNIGMKINDWCKGTIENCIICKNKEDGLLLHNCFFDIVSSNINDNKGWGIYGWATPKIEKSIITKNGKGGVFCQRECQAHNSIIAGNNSCDVSNDGTEDCDFSHNWWGIEATKNLVSKGDTVNLNNILDGHDIQGKGKIRLNNFLKEMPKNIGAFSEQETDQKILVDTKIISQLQKGTTVQFKQNAYLVLDTNSFIPFHKAIADGNTAEMQKYIKAAFVIEIEKGTSAVIVTSSGPAYGIKILEGKNKGKQGWVLINDVEPVP